MTIISVSLALRSLMVLGFIIALFGIAGLALWYGKTRGIGTGDRFDVEGSRVDPNRAHSAVTEWGPEDRFGDVDTTADLPPVAVSNVPPELIGTLDTNVPPHLAEDDNWNFDPTANGKP